MNFKRIKMIIQLVNRGKQGTRNKKNEYMAMEPFGGENCNSIRLHKSKIQYGKT